MKFLTIFGIVIELSICFVSSDEAVSQKSEDAATEANIKFSLELMKYLSKQNNANVFFSPLSITAALAMTSLGAKENTLTQIDQSLFFNDIMETSSDPMVVHKIFRGLITTYEKENSNYSLSLANRLYAQKGFEILKKFLDDTQKYYLATAQNVDFGSGNAEGTINNWVSQQTHNKINELFAPNSLDADTVLVLVNAIYFKGNWKRKFDKKSTQKMEFRGINDKKQVDMMSMTNNFPYAADDDLNVQVVEIPYTGDDLSMIVLLPNKDDGLPSLLNDLTSSKLQSIFGSLQSRKVNLKFPKFKLETKYSLVDTLKAFGIEDLFSSKADLTGISNDTAIKVSKVIHKAYVDVDEEGTEAAAATGIAFVPLSLPLNPPPVTDFIADHAFLFFVVDKRGMRILFSGNVLKP